jgi:hypothetical protein
MIFFIKSSDAVDKIEYYAQIRRDTIARFVKFDRNYKKLQKQYTSAIGGTITYGQRPSVETVDFTIECNKDGYEVFMDIFQNSYEFTIRYSFDDTQTFEQLSSKEYFLSSKITVNKIYNGSASDDYDKEGLFTISSTLEEV